MKIQLIEQAGTGDIFFLGSSFSLVGKILFVREKQGGPRIAGRCLSQGKHSIMKNYSHLWDVSCVYIEKTWIIARVCDVGSEKKKPVKV